ncbi:putative transcription factor ovo-like protein 3 [Pollicipes pollicipes]|uniref:putative transcription factor ovo-like protein 3 n=1 Tax=Pollicipes pollicipes TaxID=41117 RepID=UPI0018851EB2|nr:putative transcription factor ovo-like protein 3 [Pollicipes pollicipes]
MLTGHRSPRLPSRLSSGVSSSSSARLICITHGADSDGTSDYSSIEHCDITGYDNPNYVGYRVAALPSGAEFEMAPLCRSQDSGISERPRSRSSSPPPPPGLDQSLVPHGFMNWSLGGSGDGAEGPFVPSTEAGGAPDAFLHRAFNVRFQRLLQQQRYDQLLARAPPPPPPPPSSGSLGLPLLLRRESPTSPSRQYACEKCGRQYASSGNLKRHVKYECGVEPQFQCPVCKKKFQHRHSVKIHVVSTHKSENPELIKDYLM